jgi:predicted small integral membrane protein
MTHGKGGKEAMIAIRLVKVALVASTALFALLVAVDNVVDYDTNYAFVRHTLSMDTTFPDNALKARAITTPALWTLAYWLIIATEAAVGLLLAGGAFRLAAALRADGPRFNAAKRLVVLGAGLGFLLWFTGFMVVGGEWFAMWQSNTWNGQQAAFRFYMTLLAVLIFVNQTDGETSPR